jgi:hypothetical protein
LNWRWLPRWRARSQPSASSSLTISRIFIGIVPRPGGSRLVSQPDAIFMVICFPRREQNSTGRGRDCRELPRPAGEVGGSGESWGTDRLEV